MIWGGTPRSFPPAFSIRGYVVGGHHLLFSPQDLFTVVAVLAVAALLWALFQHTEAGLRLRASAFAPMVARLQGVRVGRMLTLGWALAALVGSLAGLLVAPSVFLGPNNFDRNPRYAGEEKPETANDIVFRDCTDCTLTGFTITRVRAAPAAVTLEKCAPLLRNSISGVPLWKPATRTRSWM